MSSPNPSIEYVDYVVEEIIKIREELEKKVALLSKNNSDLLLAIANTKEELRAIEERAREQETVINSL